MSSSSSPRHGLVAILFIGLSTLIGFWASVQHTRDLATVRAWFWIGVGLAGIYLLTVIADNLDELGGNY